MVGNRESRSRAIRTTVAFSEGCLFTRERGEKEIPYPGHRVNLVNPEHDLPDILEKRWARWIVLLMTKDLTKRLADRRITVEITEEARMYIARSGYDPVYGARPLRRFIQKELETRIGRAIMKGEIPDGATVKVGVKDGALAVTQATA